MNSFDCIFYHPIAIVLSIGEAVGVRLRLSEAHEGRVPGKKSLRPIVLTFLTMVVNAAPTSAVDTHDAGNNTPLANLFVELAQRIGIEIDRFGSSTASSVRGLEIV